MDIEFLEKELFELINIGIALTSEHEIGKLLEKIVKEARKFIYCDAGSLYIKEENFLKFVVAQNDTLDKRFGSELRKAAFTPFSIPLNKRSLSGYVAETGKTLKLDDVYELPLDGEYQFNKDFDIRNNYRSKSMLIIPLFDIEDKVLGVLQLINAFNDKDEVIPFDPYFVRFVQCLASQASVAIKNAKLNSELKRAHINTLFHLSTACEYRDDETGQHVKRISGISELIARNLNLTEEKIELIKYGSPMHDIGKIAIPDSILLKPGKLTPEERKIMEIHSIKGAKILRDPTSQIFTAAEEIALNHHEKFDGTGYPNKLKGEEIPLSGRIVALADVFDALISKRCYKPAFSIDNVIQIIKDERGKHFDPNVVDSFFKVFNEIIDFLEKYKDNRCY